MGFSILNNPAMGISHLWKPPYFYNQHICFFQRKPTEINPWHSRWGLEDQTFDLALFAFFWLGNTLWLFNIAMENCPFIEDFPIKTSIYKGFSMAMLNNQMVYPQIPIVYISGGNFRIRFNGGT